MKSKDKYNEIKLISLQVLDKLKKNEINEDDAIIILKQLSIDMFALNEKNSKDDYSFLEKLF
jgi:hypothetical protein